MITRSFSLCSCVPGYNEEIQQNLDVEEEYLQRYVWISPLIRAFVELVQANVEFDWYDWLFSSLKPMNNSRGNRCSRSSCLPRMIDRHRTNHLLDYRVMSVSLELHPMFHSIHLEFDLEILDEIKQHPWILHSHFHHDSSEDFHFDKQDRKMPTETKEEINHRRKDNRRFTWFIRPLSFVLGKLRILRFGGIEII